MKKIKNYINGNYIAISKDELPVHDPSTGDQISNVVLSNAEDFNEVINSSKSAINEWSNTTPLKRSRIISKYKELIEKDLDILAETVSI